MSARGFRRVGFFLLLLALGVAGYALYFGPVTPPERSASPHSALPVPEARYDQVAQICGLCHAVPPPDVLPRTLWKPEIAQMYDLFWRSRRYQSAPPMEAVVRYYEARAPQELPLNPPPSSAPPFSVGFEPTGYGAPNASPHPAVAHLNLVHLFDERRLDVLACDMRFDQVMVLKPYAETPRLQVIATLPHPCHAEVVDLDGDGVKDVLVACLGSFGPTDLKLGSVVLLKGSPDKGFTPITLLQGVGRVADVRAADFNGDGKLDLVVAAFGWRETGEILYLENQTTDWTRPRFVPHVLDPRHGTIHVPVADLNGDGKPDFVALISQEHETVVAFLNEGNGRFRKETIYAAPHPTVGSTGIQLVDLDRDGDLDVLLTTGDIEPPLLLLPYHEVIWLENRGKYPFTDRPLARLNGAHRAEAADFDGDGDLDIVAVSYLPAEGLGERRRQLRLDAVILLEQTEKGEFVRHTLESVACDYATCAAGDILGDGRAHFVTGSFCITTGAAHPLPHALRIWQNLGSKQTR